MGNRCLNDYNCSCQIRNMVVQSRGPFASFDFFFLFTVTKTQRVAVLFKTIRLGFYLSVTLPTMPLNISLLDMCLPARPTV